MNKAILMGNITKDIEVRKTSKGDDVVSFTIAVQRKFTNQDGERQSDFFNMTAFAQIGTFIAKYFSKGKKILVEARIQNRTWEDDKGQKRYATDFIAEQVYFADSKSEKPNDMSQIANDGDFITLDNTEDVLPF